MKNQERKLSTRLIRKGALIEETYSAFREWDLGVSFRENISKIREHNTIGAGNEKWLHEVVTTLSSRFEKNDNIAPLVILAKRELPISKWKACLLWHIGRIDLLYYQFATQWLYEQYKGGAYSLQTEDAIPYVKVLTDGRIASGGSLSEYGVKRAARDLFRMSTDFDLMVGKVKKKFANFHIPQEAFLYVLHGLSTMEGNTKKNMESSDWHLFLMDVTDVEREILRLHQYQALEYHIAGSIAQLKLPYKSLTDFARGIPA